MTAVIVEYVSSGGTWIGPALRMPGRSQGQGDLGLIAAHDLDAANGCS
jgi:hypothetical protein